MLKPSILSSGHVANGGGAIETAPHALVERPHLVFRVGVVEAEHRLGMLDRLEPFDRPPGHPLGR